MGMWRDGRCQIFFWVVWPDHAAPHWCPGFNQASSTHRSMDICPASSGFHLSWSHCSRAGRETLPKLPLCLDHGSKVICVGTVQRTCLCSKTRCNSSWNDSYLIEKCCISTVSLQGFDNGLKWNHPQKKCWKCYTGQTQPWKQQSGSLQH